MNTTLGVKPQYASRAAYQRAMKRQLERQYGAPPVKAVYDLAGNCMHCGECGRCPGWHIPSDKFDYAAV